MPGWTPPPACYKLAIHLSTVQEAQVQDGLVLLSQARGNAAIAAASREQPAWLHEDHREQLRHRQPGTVHIRIGSKALQDLPSL